MASALGARSTNYPLVVAAKARPNVDPKQILGERSAWCRPGFLLWHATLLRQRSIQAALKPLGLTHVQFTLLGSVWWLERHSGPPKQAEISEHAGTDAMMTSQVLRVLESMRLIVRRSDPSDGRARRIEMTRRGREVAERALIVVNAVDADFFGEDEGPDLLELLRRLARRDAQGARTE
jgi:DNA-binding MarR family transcriptional regulator